MAAIAQEYFDLAATKLGLEPVQLSSNVGLLTVAVGLVMVWIIFKCFSRESPNRPPRMSFLSKALRGHFNLKKEGPNGLIRYGYEKYGECFRVKILGKNMVFLVGPEANYFWGSFKDSEAGQQEVYKFTTPVFGKGLVYDAEPRIFVQQLKFLKTALSGIRLDSYGPKIVDECQQYFDAFGDEGEINLFDALSELTIYSAMRCLLGPELRGKARREFAELYHVLNIGMTHLSFFWPNAPTKAHKLRDDARRKIGVFFGDLVRLRQQRRASGEHKAEDRDFVDLCLDAEYRDGTKMTVDDVTGMCVACLFAGQHTSSITSTWMGLNIMRNWDQVGDRLRKEIKAVKASHPTLSQECLNDMELLHNSAKETLRMYAPLINLMRYARQDLKYKNHELKKGDILIVSPPVSMRLPEVFKNPNAWDPDRFARGEGMDKGEFMAFGHGRHRCLGEPFGLLQVKTIWAMLLESFDFELVNPNFPTVDYGSIVVGPDIDLCRVRYKRRVPRGTPATMTPAKSSH